MDSKTYIANALRTESVPAKLEINQIAFHSMLRIVVAATELADQFKRAIYYVDESGVKKSPLSAEKMLPVIQELFQTSGFLGNLTEFHQGNDGPLNALLQPFELKEALETAPEEIRGMNLTKVNKRLLHAALGCFTESGELVDSVKKQFETGVLDKVNFGEEVGDIEWYQAIGFDESGVSEADCREKNIAKLKARYPNKFNAQDAVVRDLTAERQILAGQAPEQTAAVAQ